jgi:hypothetical protein
MGLVRLEGRSEHPWRAQRELKLRHLRRVEPTPRQQDEARHARGIRRLLRRHHPHELIGEPRQRGVAPREHMPDAPLRVEVDQEGRVPALSKREGKVEGHGGLANAPLLTCDHDTL